MVSTLVQTDDRQPAADRFAQWMHRAVALEPVPVALRIDKADEFAAQISTCDVGVVTAVTLATRTCVPYLADRSPALIRRADPEAYRLVVNLDGFSRGRQGDHDVTLRPGDLVLYDTSSPSQIWRGIRPPQQVEYAGQTDDTWLTVTFPHALLPVPFSDIRPVLGGRLPSRTGIGAMVSALVARIVRDGDRYPAATALHMSNAVVDLLAALLTEELGEAHAPSRESVQRALLLQLQTFAERRLGNPELSAEGLAAAHHLSLRSLHRVFARQGLTVAGWIRQRRMEHVQRDLADPALAAEPIHAIATRWGFTDQAHFSRLFRAVHGMSATDYRHQHPDPGPPNKTPAPQDNR